MFLIQNSLQDGECNNEEDMKKKAPHKTALELVDCMAPETVSAVSIAHLNSKLLLSSSVEGTVV